MSCFRSGTIALLATSVILMPSAPAMGTRWIGVPARQGQVERHPAYQQILSSYPITQVDFEDIAVGTNVVGYSLSGMALYSQPPWVPLLVKSDPIAGVPPASGIRGIEISGVTGQGTGLKINYDRTVQVAGFVALNLNSDYYVSTYDQEGGLISRVLMPAVPSGHRQWIGVYEQGRDFFSLRIEPTSPGRYGIDNLEYSYHSPEPSALCLLACAWSGMLRCPRFRRPSSNFVQR